MLTKILTTFTFGSFCAVGLIIDEKTGTTLGFLFAALGIVWWASSRWQRVEDRLTSIEAKIDDLPCIYEPDVKCLIKKD